MIAPTRDNARAAGAVVLAMAAITTGGARVKGLLEGIAASRSLLPAGLPRKVRGHASPG
ncbi:MAG: hypothetical protein QGH58_09700 [Arenicellales bacterium]|mgnify:CR=1 FL=1|jgi:hypothetical protein|nr:hypothetical protein [Arenicellales bacterium]MDP6792162.1 hypothetical protein [Arenicellales bacterium]MDP6919694.1 hypothetical protein [Arenicellales bacterium]|tara:strand:+ start:1199 stop:1375 length:177 start_codon:yes stop_codon:yes gene_type:complete